MAGARQCSSPTTLVSTHSSVSLWFANLTFMNGLHFMANSNNYLTKQLTNLLATRNWIFLENVRVSHLVKKFSNLWNKRVHYRVYNCPPLVPILTQKISVPASPFYFSMILVNIILASAPRSLKWSLSFWFPHRTPNEFLLSSTFAKCPGNFILESRLNYISSDQLYPMKGL
jgi:hypothetical protein